VVPEDHKKEKAKANPVRLAFLLGASPMKQKGFFHVIPAMNGCFLIPGKHIAV
jgi:hypothetical protein